MGNPYLNRETLLSISPTPLAVCVSLVWQLSPYQHAYWHVAHFFLTDSSVGAWKPYSEQTFDLSGLQRLARIFHVSQLLGSYYSHVRHRDVLFILPLPPQSWGSASEFFCFLLIWVSVWPSCTQNWRPSHLFFSSLTFGFRTERDPFWTLSLSTAFHPRYEGSVLVFSA